MGAGTVGSIIGGYLTGSGYNVLLADGWQVNVEVLNQKGLKVSGTRGEHSFPVKAVLYEELKGLNRKFDLIFISVKSYDTAASLEAIRPLMGPETIVISTQNGINEEMIAATIGSQHVIGAVTEMSGFMGAPGEVVETRMGGGFVIGELDGQMTSRVNDIASIMAGTGQIQISENVLGLLWSKLLWNSMMNPVTAISGLGTGRILQNDLFRKIALEIGKEGYTVSNKRNIHLEPLTLMGIDPRRFNPGRPKDVQLEYESLKQLPEPLDKMPSMAQDIKNGRKTEIDFINGFIVEAGKILRIPTPINEEVVSIMHEVESKRLVPSTQILDQLASKYL
nr:2-dehydropantoate 2-reductase [Bacillus sp. FJAT-50079]